MADLDQYSVYAVYDLALERWVRSVLSGLTEKDETTIVMAGPQRAFAEAAKVVAEDRMCKGLPNSAQELMAQVPLPLISLSRGNVSARMEQRVAPGFGFRNRRFVDSSGVYNLGGKPPLPVTLDYQIDVWAETVNTFSRMTTAFQQAFDPQMSWGLCKPHRLVAEGPMPIRLEGITNNSALEGGDNDRELRFTVNVQIEGWVYYEPVDARVAKDMVVTEAAPVDFAEFHLETARYPEVYIQSDVGNTWWKLFSYQGHLVYHPVEPTEVPKPPSLFPESAYLILPETLTLKQGNVGMRYAPDAVGFLPGRHILPDSYSADALVVNKGQRLWLPKSKARMYGELSFNASGHPVWVERVI